MSDRASIPFHRPWIGEEEILAVTEVLRSGWLTTGPKVREFEDSFARFVGARQAVAVSSGTAALHLALIAAGIGPGDGVLTSPLTFPATTEVALYCGARPVFADVDRRSLNLDPAVAADVLRRDGERYRIRAIVPVHYGGQACAMEEILPLARRHGLAVIEDAAHALPAWRAMPSEEVAAPTPAHLPAPRPGRAWRKVGAIGDFTAFSFYATKPLTTGEGGMITTASDEAAELLRSLRLHGLSGDAWKRYRAEGSWRYDVARTGYKYNLPDILAALGLEQLKRADRLAAERRRLAATYQQALAPLEELVEIPGEEPACGHAWHLFPIRVRRAADRDRVIEGLRARGIGASVHFIPVHLHSFYASTYGYRRGDYPVAEEAADRLVSLPIYPGLTDDDVATVGSALRHILEEASGAR
ncbi:MAG: DegT/DnrJ/EryC1/StrS family aminotransferase [Candidatus Binatia bacterium]